MKRKSIHLICNAHIDPSWIWQWQEGLGEAISTFRTAAELCENNDNFVFNHNEVILYEWIQQYAPNLFKRIKKLVKAGKWHIMGGWYLQPDCNMPCGESFIRQILSGKAYFKKNFGTEPTTAINFDPFGHTRGLVQILAKSGYDSYLFGRPDPTLCSLPSDDFIWVGYDGSEITAHRFIGSYGTPYGKTGEKIEDWIDKHPDEELSAILWGVGNHGGGPSKKDIRDINRLIKKSPGYNITHSTPERFFKKLRRCKINLPHHKKDINPFAPGCYTSMIRIKQKHRQLENELYTLEKMASTAAFQGLMKYPARQINQGFRDLMTIQFHDTVTGTSASAVEESALEMAGHGLEIASRLKTKAFFALANGQPKAKNGRIPIMVFNHHPFKVKQLIECEFSLSVVNWYREITDIRVYNKAKVLPCQVEKENSNCYGGSRKRVVFMAELEPGRMNRFDCAIETIPKKPSPILKAKGGKIIFKTQDLQVVINTRTGLVDRYRAKGLDCLGRNSFEPIVIADNEDPWAVNSRSFRKVVGRFRLMSKEAGTKFSGIKSGTINSVRIIEDGLVRSVIEVVFSYGDSFICQRYKLPKNGTEIELEIRVYWLEKDKMLKLSVPTPGTDCKYIGQVAYGTGALPDNGDEAVAQKWTAVISRKDNMALTCINDGTYGSDFSEDGLRLSLLRAPAYSALPSFPYQQNLYGVPQDRHRPRIDQGERIFNFWFNAGPIKSRLEKIDREALTKNERPFALSFFPSGQGKRPRPLAVLNDNVVQISAIKKAEKNNDLIIRLFEPTGKKRTTILHLPLIGKKIKINLAGFEIKTLRVNRRTGKHIEVNLLEKPVK